MQKAFAVTITYPKHDANIQNKGYSCHEITELNVLMKAGWKISDYKLIAPSGTASLATGLIILANDDIEDDQ